MPSPTVAIAHDYLTQRGGAERVVLSMLRAFPDATVYTSLYDPEGTFPEFADARIVTSPLNRIGMLRRNHRAALPFLKNASSKLRVDADVTLVSTSGWAHGFDISGPRLVYCYTPARWLYLPEEYLGDSPFGLPAVGLAALRRGLTRWDRAAARRRDKYFAISNVVQRRIKDVYGIDAELLFPPHSMAAAAPQQRPASLDEEWTAAGYHLLVSRLLPYKNVDKAIEAFRPLSKASLVIVGRGPEAARLRASLPGNVKMLSGLPDAEVRWLYAHAEGLIAPSHEDFGLTPVEAAAFGTPTLALQAGGYLDTVLPGVTGAFFTEPTPAAIRDAVLRSRYTVWDADTIRAHAATFAEERFIDQLRAEVDHAVRTAASPRLRPAV